MFAAVKRTPAANAEAMLAAAEAEAEQLREAARQEALNERATAQRTVEKLERQRESIASYLDEMRGLLGSPTARSISGLEPLEPKKEEANNPALFDETQKAAEGDSDDK